MGNYERNRRNREFNREEPVEVIEEVEEVIEEAPVEETEKPVNYIVNVPRLNVRKLASTESDILKVVTKDTILSVIRIERNDDEKAEYGYVPVEDGYVNLEFLNKQ